jgi:hypothetical protein
MNRKSMMKRTIIVCIACAVLVLGGCATTYYGQADASVPIKEQCLLEINDTVTVLSFDGEDVKWERLFMYRADSVSIPAGTHSLFCRYEYVTDRRRSGNYEYYTLHTGYDTVSYDFKPGYTYRISVFGEGDVRIREEEAGEPRSVVVVPELQYLGLGMPLRSPGTGWGFVYPMQLGAVIDSDALTTGLYWDFGFGFGIPFTSEETGEESFPIIAYTGISSEFYLPSLPTGLGIGGGIASQDAFILALSPYVRLTVIPYKRFTKLKIYFDYYLPEIIFDDSIEYPRHDWGVGFNWFY